MWTAKKCSVERAWRYRWRKGAICISILDYECELSLFTLPSFLRFPQEIPKDYLIRMALFVVTFAVIFIFIKFGILQGIIYDEEWFVT